MITETTAISCATFGALSIPLLIAAGYGWIRCARLLKIARDAAAYHTHLHKQAAARARSYAEALGNSNGRAIDLEDRLSRIERQRSDNTRRGNLTRSANRKAAIAATTSQLQQNIADRAEPVRQAA